MLLTLATVATTSLTPIAPLPTATLAQEPAALHSNDAAFVLQLSDVQAIIQSYSSTALAQLLTDEAIHLAIGRVMQEPEGTAINPIDLLMGEYNNAVASGDAPPFLDMLSALSSVSLSIEVPEGDFYTFMKGMDAARDEELYVAETMGLRLVADFTDADSAQGVAEFLHEMLSAEAPGNLTLQTRALTLPAAGQFGGEALSIRSFAPAEPGGDMDPFSESMRLISGGTRIAFTAGNIDGDEYVSSLAAGALSAPATPLFAAGRKAFGKAPATPMFEFYLKPFVERALAAEEPNALPVLDLAEGLLGPLASMVIRGGHWRVGLQDGQFITEGICEPGGDGALAGLIGAQPLDPRSLELSHPDALVTSVTSLDPDVLARFVEVVAAEQGEGMLDQIEKAYGFRPERDIAGALGNAISYSLPSLKSLLSAPNLMGAAELRDRDAFIRGMDGLLGMAEDSGDDVTVQRKDYKGAMIYTLMFNPELFNLPVGDLPIDPATFFRPTITVMEDRVMFTTLPSHAQKEVRRVLKLKKKQLPPEIHGGITALGDLRGAATVGYADWPQFFGNLYAQLKSLAPLAAGMMGGGELPFDVNALPEPDQLTRHFQPSERWTRHVNGAVLHYSKSSIGPESSVLPLAGAAVFGMRSQAQMVQAQEWEAEALAVVDAPTDAPVSAAADSAVAETRNVLEDVAVAITLYELDHQGKAPAALADLLQVTDSYPKGYLDSSSVPNDGWDRALVYAVNVDSYSLRSVGPNGVDDQGAGDDVTLE